MIKQETRDVVYGILVKYGADISTYVGSAYFGNPIFSDIDLAGPPSKVAKSILDAAIDHGVLEEYYPHGRHALVILLDTIYPQVGQDNQQAIANACRMIVSDTGSHPSKHVTRGASDQPAKPKRRRRAWRGSVTTRQETMYQPAQPSVLPPSSSDVISKPQMSEDERRAKAVKDAFSQDSNLRTRVRLLLSEVNENSRQALVGIALEHATDRNFAYRINYSGAASVWSVNFFGTCMDFGTVSVQAADNRVKWVHAIVLVLRAIVSMYQGTEKAESARQILSDIGVE